MSRFPLRRLTLDPRSFGPFVVSLLCLAMILGHMLFTGMGRLLVKGARLFVRRTSPAGKARTKSASAPR